MYNSKVIRSLSLLLFFSLLLTGFGSVNVSAATNLVNPDLSEWENTSREFDDTQSFVMRVISINSGDLFLLQPSYAGDVDGKAFYMSFALDTVILKAGNSYTFSLHIPSFNEIRAKSTYQLTDEQFVNRIGDGWNISFCTRDSSGSITDDISFLTITKDNYSSLQGTDYVCSFECPDYSGSNPIIMITGSNLYSNNWLFLDSSMMLVDNNEEDEDGFFSRLFEWFQKKFDAIGDSFSNLGNKLSTGFTNLGDRIKTFFSDLGTSISNGLNSVKEGIQNKLEEVKTSLVELREGLINGIKGLFIPDDDFISGWKSRIELLLQEHLGIVWEAANFFTDLFSTVSDLLSDTENGSLEFTFPGVEFELLGHNFDLWEERAVDMSFLETDSFWSFWYGLYKIILVIILCFALVLYGYNTLEGKLRR